MEGTIVVVPSTLESDEYLLSSDSPHGLTRFLVLDSNNAHLPPMEALCLKGLSSLAR